MKRKILRSFVGLVVLAAFTLPSCEFLEDCATCESVTDDGSGNYTYGTPLIFCGETLEEKRNEVVEVGSTTTYWSCN